MLGCAAWNAASLGINQVIAKAGISVTGRAEQALGALHQPVEDVAHDRQIVLTDLGELDPAADAAEQRTAELRFETLDAMADRALGEIELFGSLGEARMPRGGLEGAQGVERRKRNRHIDNSLVFLIC